MQWSRVSWCLQMRKSVMIIWCGWSCYVVLVKICPYMKIVFVRYKNKWNEDHKSFMVFQSRKYNSVVTNLIFLKFLQTHSGFKKKNCNHVKWSCSVISSKVISFYEARIMNWPMPQMNCLYKVRRLQLFCYLSAGRKKLDSCLFPGKTECKLWIVNHQTACKSLLLLYLFLRL